MNMELYQLQKEVRELRQQNYEKQKNIHYIPFNIISNNLYINNSLNKSSINSYIPKDNNIYSTFKTNKEKKPKKNLAEKKKTSFTKLPLKKGMFSYKNTPINLKNYNNNMQRSSSNINFIESNEPNNYNYNNYKNSHNNSLLSAELKLNLDDNNNNISNNFEQNKSMGARNLSMSFLDLNKYRINKNKMNYEKNDIKMENNNKKIKSNKVLFLNNNNKNNYYNNFILVKNKHLTPKLIINKDPQNNLSMSKDKKKKVRKIADYFKDNPKNEKESRRMIIEYIKILNRKQYKNKKNYSAEDIDKVIKKNNISKKVLNKEYKAEDFNSFNIFNKSSSYGNANDSFILNNSPSKNFLNNKDNKNNNKQKIGFTPIKNNISNFLSKMNDAKKDKIKMISFLSIPRIMNLYFLNKKYKYIFLLSPSKTSYQDAIESYIFQFENISTKKFVGGFDLIKVNSCSQIKIRPNNFQVQTYNGKFYRNYEFETKSPIISEKYVRAFNYLVQLVKCKIYNYKSIYNEEFQ